MAKQPYEKPIPVKDNRISIDYRLLHHGKQIVCRQCSSCHGCR